MRKFAHSVLLLFSLLGILFIPFSFNSVPFQSKITAVLFGDLISTLTRNFRGLSVVNPQITSDSTTFYLLLGILFVLSILLLTGVHFFNFWKKYQARILQAIQLVMVYYLAVVMLKYGVDKIFKAQFYLPEPNTLYTPLGMLDKDILYWSTMGVSHSYNVFMGLAEVLPALLLLCRQIRTLGLCILSGVLLHVVFVNFGFDISVKAYSLFLLLLCLLLLLPAMRSLWQFFIQNKEAMLLPVTGKTFVPSKSSRLLLKSGLLVFLLAESLLPYLQSGQYNDDLVPRNLLHGAYKVLSTVGKNQKAPDKDFSGKNLKRIFIHRQNFLIFQYADDRMEDFSLTVNPNTKELTLTDYEGGKMILPYKYAVETQLLELQFPNSGNTLYCKGLPWRTLPLLQPLFHWTVDGVQQ